MSLIKCPDCGREISDSSITCIGCGCDIVSYLQRCKFENKRQDVKNEKEEYYKSKYQEIYNSVVLPTELPNDKGIRKAEKITAILGICTIITIITSIIKTIYLDTGSTFLLPILFFAFTVYSFFVKIPDEKNNYYAAIQKHNTVMKYPDAYKKKITEEIMSNDSNLKKFDDKLVLIDRDERSELKRTQTFSTPSSDNTPRCPTCGSTYIKRIGTFDKMTGIFFFGVLSTNARKQFECKNCNYKW